MRRRLLLATVSGSAVVLLPWIWFLAISLPKRHDVDQWRLAWVGFDVGLVGCFAAASWLGWRRHRAAGPVLAATAALLVCDAWFDVLLDWRAPDRWLSVLLAVLVELPLAAVLLTRARDLVVAGMPQRALTPEHIAIRRDAVQQALMEHLSQAGSSSAHAIATALGRTTADVTKALTVLAAAGFVGRDWRGRWVTRPLSLRMPPADESWARSYLDAKYDNELRLLTNAARNHAHMGSWGKGERAAVHLTADELARFNAEYLDLMTRYCLLHPVPTERTRSILVRFYAFPRELAESSVSRRQVLHDSADHVLDLSA